MEDYIIEGYLLNSVSTNSTGDALVVNQCRNFTVSFENTGVAVGSVTLQGRVTAFSNWLNINSLTINNVAPTGILYQFNGPYQALRATLTNRTSGDCTVICKGKS